MFTLSKRQRNAFDRIRRKHKVSLEFIEYNMPNILKFLAYHGKRLHFVLRRCAVRHPRNRTVVIKYNHLRRSLFDETQRKRLKCRKRNLKQWSKHLVLYLRKVYGVKEFVVIEKTSDSKYTQLGSAEVSKQLKEQLELLKSGKRSTQLIDSSEQTRSKELDTHISDNSPQNSFEAVIQKDLQENSLSPINKEVTSNTSLPITQLSVPNEKDSPSKSSQAGILDILMSKVGASVVSPVKEQATTPMTPNELDTGLDSGEEFLGFCEDDNLPGMMRTPVVPLLARSKDDNSVFVSEALDEYFRENSLDMDVDLEKLTLLSFNRKFHQANIDGLVTLNCVPPTLEMPAVPSALQKLRTVAERRHYLQKFSKNYKLAIINNEATIFRELQRKIRHPKLKICTQQTFQAACSKMSFTRQGWHAASFVTTDLNKYYFQKVNIDHLQDFELRGVFGNSSNQYKKPYISRAVGRQSNSCGINCVDCNVGSYFKVIPTFPNKKKLCHEPLRAIIKPCPLSQKPFQPLLDGEASDAIITEGNLSVVRLPTVELNVYPEVGKPFNDIARRYLEYVMPYQSITREWAEFSLSVLTHKADDNKRRKSFAFPVPYLNNRNQILVRRVADRNEKVDPCFKQRETEFDSKAELSFCAQLDERDEIQMDCANVLAEMINSVAISCSENSFINKDPDRIQLEPPDMPAILTKSKTKNLLKAQTNAKTLPTAKKSRLISELRRLNATIIDTKLKKKNDVEPCAKESCALGCICESIGSSRPLLQHCAKPQCMFECDCEKKTKSQIFRLKSNNHTISTEDAYMMRREATSRLARMEKEFTSTVVVTENETLLINDSQYDKKRRCAKVPKRYEDFRGPDEELSRLSPIKSSSSSTSTSSPLITELSESKKLTLTSTDIEEPVHVKDFVLQKLKHCSVALTRFPDISNMAVFCMVHQLYKCFCGGRAIEGKRVVIEKEVLTKKALQDNATIPKTKSAYTFERTETENESNQCALEKEDFKLKLKRVRVQEITPVEEIKLAAKPQEPKETIKIELDFSADYFKKSEKFGCTRFVPVPARTYGNRNLKRRDEIFEFIQSTENKISRLLLNERIMRSIYYHKEKQRKHKMATEQAPIPPKRLKTNPEETVVKLKIKSPVKKQKISTAQDSSLQPVVKKARKSKETKCDDKKLAEEPNSSTLAKECKEEQFPKISACYSLNSYTKEFQAQQQQIQNSTEIVPTSNDVEMETDNNDVGFTTHYNEIIKMLNGLVSRKMHDIDNALKRDSKIVPQPTEDILCVLQWKNFLDAFREGLIYIWEVKMKTRTFLAATVANVIPMVFGALAVINIRAVPKARLTLLGSMLLHNFTMKDSQNLAVIMQGRSQYWYIKGFLQPNLSNVCLKPTPDTHPTLTQKINTLCSSLMKQRTKELDKRGDGTTVKSVTETETKVETETKMEIATKTKTKIENPTKQVTPTSTQSGKSILNSEVSPTKSPTPSKNIMLLSATVRVENPATITKSKRDDLKKTNVAVREMNFVDLKEINRPEYHAHDHKWFVLDMQSDFSHIFVPDQKEIISLERIQRLMALSKAKTKVIQIQFLKRAFFDAYIVPGSENKVYFGPFRLGSAPPVLVLLQSVERRMMTRETYQRVHKIQKSTKSTSAFWMIIRNGEIELTTANLAMMKTLNENRKSKVEQKPEIKTKSDNKTQRYDDDDDDDCMIIDGNNKLQQQQQHPTTSIVAQTDSKTKNQEKKTLPPANNGTRINFTIQTTPNTNELKITPSLEITNNSAKNSTTIQQQQQQHNNKQFQNLINRNIFISELLPNTTTKKSTEIINSGNVKILSPKTLGRAFTLKSQQQQQQQAVNPSNNSTQNGNNLVLTMQAKKTPQRQISTTGGSETQTQKIVTQSSNIPKGTMTTITTGKAPLTNVSSHLDFKQQSMPNHNQAESSSTAGKVTHLQILPALKRKIITSINSTMPNAKPNPNVNDNSFQAGVSSNVRIPKNDFIQRNALIINSVSSLHPINVTPLNTSATKTMPTTATASGPTTTTLVIKPATSNRNSQAATLTLNDFVPAGATKPMQQVIKLNKVKSVSVQPKSIISNQQLGKSNDGVAYKATSSKNVISSKQQQQQEQQMQQIQQQIPQQQKQHQEQQKKLQQQQKLQQEQQKKLQQQQKLQQEQQRKQSQQQQQQLISLHRETQMSNEIINNVDNVNSAACVYGCFRSNVPELPRFFAQRKQNQVFIKLPGVGIAKVKGLDRVKYFLNQHIATNMEIPVNNKIKWIFEPTNNLNALDNATKSEFLASSKRAHAEIESLQLDITRQKRRQVLMNADTSRKQTERSETIVIED